MNDDALKPDVTFLPSFGLSASAVPWVTALVFVVFAGWIVLNWRRSSSGTTTAGGLNYVTGPMGAGKSMFGVRLLVDALTQGRYAVTNVRLLDGWADKVAARMVEGGRFERTVRHLLHARNPRKRERIARWLEGFYVYTTSLQEAMRYVAPCAYCGGNPLDVPDGAVGPTSDPRTCNHAGPRNEGRAVVVWDEGGVDLNNRAWDGSHAKDASEARAEKRRRALVIRWATQARKLGYVAYLLAQNHESTDKQLRDICNHLIRLQNQRNTGGLGVLLPRRLALFLVYWYPAHLADGTTRVHPVRFERYLLPWTRSLYNSWETFHGIHDGTELETTAIVLPAGGDPTRRRQPVVIAPSSDVIAAPAAGMPAPRGATEPLSRSRDAPIYRISELAGDGTHRTETVA